MTRMKGRGANYLSVSHIRRGAKFSQHAVPVTKVLLREIHKQVFINGLILSRHIFRHRLSDSHISIYNPIFKKSWGAV